MRFWDSSALVPLLVDEAETDRLLDLYRNDAEAVVWWGTEVECASAIARLEREDALTVSDATTALRRLRALAESWHRVEPTDRVRDTAVRLLRVHDLRAADSLQLAAAVVVAEQRPATLELVSCDARLTVAAEREGFPVL